MSASFQPAPEFSLSTLLSDGLLTPTTLFIGCLSFEKRCLTAIKNIDEYDKTTPIINYFISIEDDECSYLPWRTGCSDKMSENFKLLQDYVKCRKSYFDEFKMSRRSEEILRIKHRISDFLKSDFAGNDNVRCILDVSCFPSYFALQILKTLFESSQFSDIIIIYTKPLSYDQGQLKYSPRDKSRSGFLPFFGQQEISKAIWIVGVGFDSDSVINASSIRETLTIENTIVIVPFPGFKHEFFIRTMVQNADILNKNDENYRYAHSESPFRTFDLLKSIVKRNAGTNCILSSFGPKPMCLGFGLAAIKYNLPILHVQATNYNPDFSSGEKEPACYIFKINNKLSF